MAIDYDRASKLLASAFNRANAAYLAGTPLTFPVEEGSTWLDQLFTSKTQAFREVLLGCLLARISDKAVDIRKPYASQGVDAFNGRTLDEKVVNPLLQQTRIPCSKGPYLSVFRRSVEFTTNTRSGIRDKAAYDAFLHVLDYIEAISNNPALIRVLHAVAYRFVNLREASNIPLARIRRFSLNQLSDLIAQLLNTPSGGRFPMFIVIAAFQALANRYKLDWDISWQGINVADAASGVGGDVIVSSSGDVLFAAEVTERVVHRNRVIATFNSKISPNPMDDYLFFVPSAEQPEDSVQQLHQYFTQGHEVNFIVIQDWVSAVLATVGSMGRSIYIDQMLSLLESEETPASVKVGWNEAVNRTIGRE